MKKKPASMSDPVVPKEILEKARRDLKTDMANPRRPNECVVCGAECAPTSAESLCWVCRRLKISAWRDNDSQITASE